MRVISIPGDLQNGNVFHFVEDSGVLKCPQIELPDAAIGSAWGKYVLLFGEMDVVHFFIMGNKLCEDCLLLDVPNAAGGVNRAGAHKVKGSRVPVKRCERGREFVFVDEVWLQFDLLVIDDFPNLKVLPWGGQQIGLGAILNKIVVTLSGSQISFVAG